MWARPHAERGIPAREAQPRTSELDFAQWPERVDTKLAGLLLTIPDLVALDLPALVKAAGYPGTRIIPALSSVLSLLALKLTGTRRVSHVEELATDPGAALFAGLTSLPKATALTTYSYRLQHAKQAEFLTALNKATLTAVRFVAPTGQWPKKGECLPDKEGHYVEVPQVHSGAMLLS